MQKKIVLFFVINIVSIMCFRTIQAQRLKLPPSSTQLTLKIGQKCSYEFKRHISVGLDADFQIENEAVLVLKKEKIRYNNPIKLLSGASGADGGKATFIFKAQKAGNTTLKISNTFRREIQESYTYNITVIEK